MKFVAIDVETANPQLSSICQVGVVGFEGGEEVFAASWFVDPDDYFDGLHVSIHGIDEARVAGAPRFAAIYQRLDELLSEQVVISHTAFDRSAIHQACARHAPSPISCRWMDSAKVARRAWPQFAQRGYGLANVAAELGITFRHHDALEDARAAGQIMLRAVQHSGLPLEDWFARCGQPIGDSRSVARSGDGDGPLLGETVVITGALSAPRQSVADVLHEAGAAVDAGVTKRTTLLVVGDQDISKLAGKSKSAKHLKAEELIGSGYPIRIIGETDLAAMLST
jgi:DNA polymerase-3 subunit epsilon